MPASIFDLPPIPTGYSEEAGFLNSPAILINNDNHSGRCRFCGAAHEGTASHGIRHWMQCAGIVAFARMRACHVAEETALRIATVLHRDLTPREVSASVEEWAERDWLSAVAAGKEKP